MGGGSSQMLQTLRDFGGGAQKRSWNSARCAARPSTGRVSLVMPADVANECLVAFPARRLPLKKSSYVTQTGRGGAGPD
jgi:hypothetical protein